MSWGIDSMNKREMIGIEPVVTAIAERTKKGGGGGRRG